MEGESISEPIATVDRKAFVVVVTAPSVSRRAFSTGDTPARLSVAGGIGALVRRTAGGESVPELVATVDRVVIAESWAIENVTSLSGDS